MLLPRPGIDPIPVPHLHNITACHRPLTITQDYRRGRHVVSALHVHLVFVTKYRRGVPGAGMLQCCQDTTRKARAGFGAELRDFHGQHDHVHLLADYPPKAAISALVNSLKRGPARQLRTDSTGQVNRHITHGHLWSPSCFATSRGGAPPGIIRHYIKQQRRPVNATSGLTPPRRTAPPPGHYGHAPAGSPSTAR